MRRFPLVSLSIGTFALFAIGCGNPDKMLAQQADEVCACATYDCGMDVLKGPINTKLKAMDKTGTAKLSDEGKRSKQRMMGCLLALKAKELEPGAAGTTGVASAAPDNAAQPKPPFTSSAGGYTVSFPFGAPEEKVTVDAKGVRWFDAKSTVGAYVVSYADFPSTKRAQAYVDDFIKNMRGEITSNESVVVGSATGRELTMKISENATMWLRIVAVDKRVYKVTAGTKNDKTKAYAFLDSFALSSAAAK